MLKTNVPYNAVHVHLYNNGSYYSCTFVCIICSYVRNLNLKMCKVNLVPITDTVIIQLKQCFCRLDRCSISFQFMKS